MFKKFSDNIYIQPADGYTDRPNVGYIKGEKYALLFESGNSRANVNLLRDDLEKQGLKQPDIVAISHWHWDHSFGLHAWNVPTVAGGKTNEKLREVRLWEWDDASMAKRVETKEDIVFCNEMIKREYPDRSQIKVVPADIEFTDTMKIDLGGIECILMHAKGPHSDDRVICYIPKEKFVFLGDSNGKDLYGKPWHFDIEHEEDFMKEVSAIPYDKEVVREYLAFLDNLDFENCIGGHADIMTKEELYRSLK